jgi:hypothetical protein
MFWLCSPVRKPFTLTEDSDSSEILNEAQKLDLDLVITLGVSEENGSVILHNLGTDLDALFLLKTFVATLEMAILEELYDRSKKGIH